MKIINSHTHLLKNVSEEGLHGTIEDLKKDMAAGGINTCMVFAHFGGEKIDYATSELIELVKSDSKFNLIYAIETKKNLVAQRKEVEKYFKLGLIKGIKVHLGYDWIYPEDKKLIPFYKLCEKYDYPVIFHTGDTYGGKAKVKYAHPLAIDSLAVDRPSLKIIIAHIGNPWVLDAAEVVYKNKNVYGDISGLILDFTDKRGVEFTKKLVNDFISYAGGNKLLFGTDFPLTNSATYIKFAKSLDLNSDEEELMFHGNAEALFKLK
jgi:hypothetical protein